MQVCYNGRVISRKGFLRLEWGLSLAIIAFALAWATVRGLPLAGPWQATPRAVAAGAATGAALWLAIPLLFRIPDMRRVFDTVLVPFSRTLEPADIITIALLSGVSEELLFRGVLLPEIGLIGSSVLFGLLHALNWTYAAWAALIGAGFGLLALYGGTLVTPVVAHATYNLGALVVLRHWRLREPAPQGGPNV